MKRIFIVEGREFPDPDHKMTVDEVRQHLANFFPELSNAETIDRGERKKPSTAPAAAPPPVAVNAEAAQTTAVAVVDTAAAGTTPPAPEEVEHLWEYRKRVGTKG